MHRFFIQAKDVVGKNVFLRDEEQLHHARDVLRLNEGEKSILCDEFGAEWEVVFKSASAQEAVFTIVKKSSKQAFDSVLQVTVACAIPKNVAFDDMINKLTQLGVKRIIPMITERVIVKLNAEKEKSRLARWKKIAASASAQSQRNTIALVDQITDFKDVLAKSSGFGIKLIPALIGERVLLNQLPLKEPGHECIVLIGPEGDFTFEELADAKASGFIPVSLGELTLRVDTAAIAAVSYLRMSSISK